MEVHIEHSWKEKLGGQFKAPYFKNLSSFVHTAYADDVVYPPPKAIFRAFDLCPFEQVKVVILGQDPYHGVNQANGLCFAVHEKVPLPPSLKNIFKEIDAEFGELPHPNGDLSRWANQGVLLLNATLTVQAKSPGSHQNRGWEEFTDAAVEALSSGREHLVFMLWGKYAKQKGARIDRAKHLVLEAAHPSPFSAYSGFFGCRHFALANEYLQAHNKTPIDWS